MSKVEQLIAEHIDIWTSAILDKSTAGRGGNKKYELYGIKKLRELILELAVRGKLVPQDPSDEPASVLLERIEAEKAKLIKEGKVKKAKPLAEISEDEKPFEIPEHWEWTKLGICSADIHYGFTASANESLTEYRLLRITDIQNDKVNWDEVPGCEITPGQAENYLLTNSDILIARTGGTIGKSYLVENILVNSVFASYLIRVKKLDCTNARYLKIFLGSQSYWSQLYAVSMGTGQPNVNGNALKNLALPLPPIAEQQRIVAKVDELMLLCDQLEQQTETSIDAHATLVEVLLATLTDSADANELAQNWARVSEHFATLFTTEQSIEALKQTLLQLAVMGKLVPQDPDDEPAAVLLEKIAAEKAQLIKDKKIKKEKPLPPIGDDEKPFELPKGWKWCRLQYIGYNWGQKKPGKDFTYIDVGSINKERGLINEASVLSAEEAPSRARKIVKKGTVIYSTVRPYLLNIAIVDQEFVPEPIASTAFAIVHPLEGMSSDFIYRYLRSPSFVSYVENCQTGVAYPAINDKHFFTGLMPVPPSSEQQRIITKLDELMNICDQLKTNLQQSQETQVQLTDALIDQALG